MLNITISLPEKLSTNKIYRMHHFAKAKFQQEVNMAVLAAVREQKIKKIEKYPVACNYVFYVTGKTLDILNTAGMAKAVEDGLRYAGVLIDDSLKYIKPVKLDEERSDKNYSYVTVELKSYE